MINVKDVKYIYNIEQARFYISEGCRVLDTGINPNTKRTWFKFSTKETQIPYEIWVARNKNN